MRGLTWWLLTLAAALAFPLAVFADFDPPYPRIAVYIGTNSSGYPIIQDQPGVPLVSRSLDDSMVEAYARFSLSILHATPLADLRKDVAGALRQKNPKTKVFAYIMPNTMWCGEGYDPSTYFSKHWRLLKKGAAPSCDRDTNRFLFFQDGTSPYDLLTITHNMALRELQPDSTYKYVLAEEMAQLVYESVYLSQDAQGKKVFDGIFHDVYCFGIAWMEASLGKQFDHVRAGYSTHADFLAGWDAGQAAYARKLRSLIGDNDYPIVGNCGQGDLYSDFNGWMVENFPLQNGGTWYQNMYRLVGGYFNWERLFRKPTVNIFSSSAWGISNTPTGPIESTVNTAANCQAFRFGIGSASLGSGFADLADANWGQPFWAKWRFPEQAVNTITGKSSSLIANHGWLGQPKAEQNQIIWAPDTTLGANPSFEVDTSGWTLTSFPPAVTAFSREAGTAPSGSYALRANVTSIGAGAWMSNVSQQGTFTATFGLPYAITFWAKGDKEGRIIDVIMSKTSDNSAIGVLSLPITTAWKRYQIVFTPQLSATAAIRFDLGRETGTVWLDDIKIQQGVTSVYRRDFNKGLVLVNPTGTALNVSLGATYRKIWDDATLCPGYSYPSDSARKVSEVTISPNDSMFLLNLDGTPPASPGGLGVSVQSN